MACRTRLATHWSYAAQAGSGLGVDPAVASVLINNNKVVIRTILFYNSVEAKFSSSAIFIP